jgi:hypothetical protein
MLIQFEEQQGLCCVQMQTSALAMQAAEQL